jgi:predicted metal-dependent phosphoesterase TrpH
MEVIGFIKSIDAVAVLAHPFLNLEETQLRDFLRQAVQAGLDAMEVYYPKFSPQQSALAEKIAAEYGILPSGGSDFHGANKPDIRMGTGRDNLKIPCSVLENLAARKQ